MLSSLQRHTTGIGFWVFVAGCLAGAFAPPASAKPKTDYAALSAELNTTALQAGQQAVVAVVLNVKPGYHAQSHTPHDPNGIKFEINLGKGVPATALEAQYPAGVDEDYPGVGKLNVYAGRAVAYVPVVVKADAPAGPVKITGTATVQVCDNTGTCFFPEDMPFTVETKIIPAGEAVKPNRPDLFKAFDPTKAIPTTAPAPGNTGASSGGASSGGAKGSFKFFGHTVGQDSYFLAFFAALLIGIIFNVMPCVLPVLPLKAIGFYEVSQHNRAKSLAFGFVFSLGIVTTFAALAVLVLVLGKNWGEWFAIPWVVWVMVVILVLMALGSWGLFTFNLPVGIYNFDPRHDTYIGNFLFGILTAVLSTPCTAPIFPGLLVWAAAAPRVAGVGIVMMVGVGMALPYLVLSALPELARKLPRTGPWSELVKQMMGFLLLGVAAYFAGQRLLSENNFMWGVFVVTLAACAFLIFRTVQLMPRTRPIVVSCIIALLLGGGMLYVTRAVTGAGQEGPAWADYTPDALAAARQQKKMVLVKFTAKWCANCQYVEATVFPDPRTLGAIKQHKVVMLKADLTTRDAIGWPILKDLNPSGGIPLTAIYSPQQGDPILLASIYTTQTLLDALDQAEKVRTASGN